MRRAVLAGMAAAALASGCGGGSDQDDRPTAAPPGSGPAGSAQVADGRLGAAVVARPGETKVTGRVKRITGRSILPPSTKHALGAEENCADAEIQPSAQNLAHVSDVIFCLMNAMRENEGLPDLQQHADLAEASVAHSQDMVANKYFAHDSLDGRDLVARLRQAAYIPKSGDWVVGENLAWGAGALATPKALVNAWMNSPGHRANLLSGDFAEVGMGAVLGTPSKDAAEGITVTTDFGTRIAADGTASRAGDAGSGSDTGTGTGSGGEADLGSGNSSADAGGVAGRKARAAKRRRAVLARRKRALRRCAKRHGVSKRRCIRAARRIR
jgi:uncharacterized protein YkwD